MLGLDCRVVTQIHNMIDSHEKAYAVWHKHGKERDRISQTLSNKGQKVPKFFIMGYYEF